MAMFWLFHAPGIEPGQRKGFKFPLHFCPEFCIFVLANLRANNLIPQAIMKKRDRLLEVADLKAVAHYEDELVLYIDSEDPNIPASLCVQANFNTRQFGPVQPMGVYLELYAYQHIHDGDRRIAYRQRIREEMNPGETAAMLSDFTQKRLLNLGNDNLTGWEPSWEHPWGG
jgi:hypothetical protein